MCKGVEFKKKLYHPNSLTMYRVAVIPLLVVLLMYPGKVCTFFAAILFSLAAITDYLDGYFARRQGLVSTFGKIMDPLADKLLVSSALIMMASHGWIPAWLVCLLIAREMAVNGIRLIAVENRADVSASGLGKYKTGFQIAAIIPLLFHYTYFDIDMHAIGTAFLWIALVLSIWSGIDYFFKFRKLLFS